MKDLISRLGRLSTMFLAVGAFALIGCDSDDDGMLEAETPGTIVEVAQEGGFNTLVTAVQAAGLVETLSGDGPFTVFAPTDAAFAALPAGTVESLLLPENIDQLTSILTYHVVSGRVTAEQVVGLSEASTVQGGSVAISVDGGTVRINNATVTVTDIEASNGIVHVIDTVLLPSAE